MSKIIRFRLERWGNWASESMVMFCSILRGSILHLDSAWTDHSDEHELLHRVADNFCDDRRGDKETNQEDKDEERGDWVWFWGVEKGNERGKDFDGEAEKIKVD